MSFALYDLYQLILEIKTMKINLNMTTFIIIAK